MKKLPNHILELPLEQRAELALKEAVENVILENARKGLPVYIWRHGKVVEMSPEELRAHSANCRPEG